MIGEEFLSEKDLFFNGFEFVLLCEFLVLEGKCWTSVPFHTRNPVSLRRWISFGMLSGKGFGLLIKSIE